MIRRFLPALALVALVICWTRPAHAAEPLKAIPDDVAVVVRFQSIDKFLGGLNDMMTAIGPPATEASKFVANGLGNEFFELAGSIDKLNRKVPAYAAVFPEGGSTPPVIWFVQSKTEKDLHAALVKNPAKVKPAKTTFGFTSIRRTPNRTWYYRKIDSWWCYTQRIEYAKKVADILSKKAKPLGAIADGESKKLWASNQVGVFVNAQGLTKKFKPQIDLAQNTVNGILSVIPDAQLGASDPKAARKVYSKLINSTFQAVRDARWLVVYGGLGGDGALANATVGFQPDSGTAKIVKALPDAQLDNAGLLPPGQVVYAGFEIGVKGLGSELVKLNFGAGADTKEGKDAIKTMTEGRLISQVFSFSLPKDKKTGLMVTSIEEAKDAKKYMEGFAALMKTIGTIKTPIFNQTVKYKSAASKHKNVAIDELFLNIAITDPNLAMMQGLFDKLFGGKIFQTRVARIENLVISSAGNNPKLIRNSLDNLQSGEKVAGLDDAFAKTREKLGENANLLFMINAPQLVIDAINFISDIPPFDKEIGQLPFDRTIKAPRSYSGFSLKKSKNGITATLFVPVEQPKILLRFFGPAL